MSNPYNGLSHASRISTGVKGLDELMEGGLIPGRVYLIVGPPGSGKTTLSFQFLIHGAKIGEKGLYVSLIDRPDEVVQDIARYEPSIFAYIKSWKIMLYDLGAVLWKETTKVPTWRSVLSRIKDIAEDENVDRLVIDPLSAIEFSVSNPAEKRAELARFIRGLEGLNVTTYLVAEMTDLNKYTAEHYLASGVIMLHNFMYNYRMIRAIQILKMRGTRHDTNLKKIEFTYNGIVVFNKSPFED